jgi:transcriptional regulator with XRE-family HTH domain
MLGLTMVLGLGESVRFARRLRQLMREKGLTQYALAKRSGLSRQTVSYILGAGRDPVWSTVRRLARGLGVTVQDFDVGEPEGVPTPEQAAPGRPGRKAKKGGKR